MSAGKADIVVAGHICLDIIPDMQQSGGSVEGMLTPGKLTQVGPALVATGGAVSNTGLALHRLGFPVRLMGKIGNDGFGKTIVEVLESYGNGLADGMIVAEGEHSSYSIVISPPGVDRIFLHATGANDTFRAADVRPEMLAGARLFHFGYPPLMRRMYERGGEELERLLSGAKSAGLTVSLDLARPDPGSPAGRADWRSILARTLPHVDVFMPSYEEILFMLRPDRYQALAREYGSEALLGYADGEELTRLAGELLGMGAAVVALKLGEYGLYVRTTDDPARLSAMGPCAPQAAAAAGWTGRELLAPCFRVGTAGTTGAGDCTIAGFLGGLAQGLALEQTLLCAVGTGACNVERADAVSGVPAWSEVRRRIAAGWPQRERTVPLSDWRRIDAGDGACLYEKG